MITPSCNISIAGIGVLCQCADENFLNIIRNKFASFEDAVLSPGITFIEIIERPFNSKFDEIILEERGGGYSLRSEDFNAEISLTAKKVRLETRLEITVFNTFLRILYSLLAIEHQGFLIHAAGLVYKNKGFIFSGPSSSGKTTTARRAKDLPILNDELTFVRLIGNDYQVFATPFTGEYEGRITAISAPLKILLFLNKTLQVVHEPVSALNVMIKLMENIFFFNRNLAANELLLANCRRLAENIRGYEVNILASKSIEEVIDGIENKEILPKPQDGLATHR